MTALSWNEKHLLKLVNHRQRLIARIAQYERQHRNAEDLRARLIRITAAEIRTLVRIQKRKVAA